MPIIDNNTINEIRNSVDIVEIISSYLPLTSKGKNYFGVCPFHDDHSPSMSVSREKQIYTCFSCGATGNVFKFIQDYENISFIESVKKCADIANIELNISNVKRKNDKYQKLYDIYELSQKFYQNNINTEIGKMAKNYLQSRNITDDMIKEFGIGLSLNNKDSLTKLLKKKEYSDKDLLDSGLVNENDFELSDVYRNRIMFPLYNLNGKIVGYNGRVYNGEKENKYVNSKETKIFKKRELLYNYHRAKDECRRSKRVIIHEGQLDVIRTSSIGIKECVATLGTAFGKEQALLIRKLSSNVILCFDGDNAGLKATKTAIIELSKLGIKPLIVRLEDNLDPDEYILKKGKDAFIDKINNPMNVLEFEESLLKKEYNLNNAEELAKYINYMILNINKIDDDILKEITINKLSLETGVSKEIIKSKIATKKEVKIEPVETKKQKTNKYIKSQQYLLYYMLLSNDVIKMYEKKITYMPTEKYRHLAFQIDYFFKQNGFINIADLISYINEDLETIKTLGEITSLNLNENIDLERIDDYLNNIKEYNEKTMIKNYKLKLASEDNYERKLELAKKTIELKRRNEENDR